jgi:LEA14-like dessication related protein
MRKVVVVGAVTATAAALACASSGGPPPPPFYRPNVSLRDVKLGGVGISGGAVQLVLSVYNPNLYQLESPRVRYRVYVDSVPLARGLYDADLVLASRDSITLQMPASFSYLSLGQASQVLLNTGAANYRVVGDITVSTPYGRYTFPYDRAGWFSSFDAARGRQ